MRESVTNSERSGKINEPKFDLKGTRGVRPPPRLANIRQQRQGPGGENLNRRPTDSERLDAICDLVFELRGVDGPDCKWYGKRKKLYDKLDKILLGEIPKEGVH